MVESLRNERIVDISAGVKHAAVVTEDGRVYTWGFNFYD